MEITCVICTELLEAEGSLYTTQCGHLFHHDCLTDWIKRSQTCPQCRNTVTASCIFPIYVTLSEDKPEEQMQTVLDEALKQIQDLHAANQEKDNRLLTLHEDLKKNEELLNVYSSELDSLNSVVEILKEQQVGATLFANTNEELQQWKVETQCWQEETQRLKREMDQMVLEAQRSKEETDKLKVEAQNSIEETQRLKTEAQNSKEEVERMKAELENAKVEMERSKMTLGLREEMDGFQTEAGVNEVEHLTEEVQQLERQMQHLREENVSLKKKEQTLNGEIQRQNMIYNELMIQISLQENDMNKEENGDDLGVNNDGDVPKNKNEDFKKELEVFWNILSSDEEIQQQNMKYNDHDVPKNKNIERSSFKVMENEDFKKESEIFWNILA